MPELQLLNRCTRAVRAVARQKTEPHRLMARIEHVKNRTLRRDDGRQLGQDETADGVQVLLSLQHPAELGEVRLEPVLFGVLLRGVAQVADHFVDRVFEGGDFALSFDGHRARQVALGDRGRHFRDRTYLCREVSGELIDVFGQPLPRACRARDFRLSAEHSFDADLTRNARHLLGEGCERVDHAVDRIGERCDLALRIDG